MDFKKDPSGFCQMAVKLGIILPFQVPAVKLEILDSSKLSEVIKSPVSLLQQQCTCGQCGDTAKFVVLQIDGAIVSRFQAAALVGLFEAEKPPANIDELIDYLQPASIVH